MSALRRWWLRRRILRELRREGHPYPHLALFMWEREQARARSQ